mgnify:CR=1 FL=1
MPQRLFLDNWTSFLEAPAAAAAVTLTVGTAAAARLVGLADGNYYPLTLSRIEPVEGQMRETAWEIVHITAKAGGVLTVLRGQEGTTARDWLEGEMVSMRMTAAALTEIYTRLAAVEAAIPPPPEVGEFEISVLVADSIYGSFGWDTTGEYTGSSATPSALALKLCAMASQLARCQVDLFGTNQGGGRPRRLWRSPPPFAHLAEPGGGAKVRHNRFPSHATRFDSHGTAPQRRQPV